MWLEMCVNKKADVYTQQPNTNETTLVSLSSAPEIFKLSYCGCLKSTMTFEVVRKDCPRDIFLTLAHSENKRGDIYTPDLQRMAVALGTRACETRFIVVGYEHENIKMAIKMKSQVPTERIVNKIRNFFNGYSGEIDRLRRIDNARRGQGASRNVPVKKFPDDMDDKERYEMDREFVDNIVGAHGSWAAVMRSPKNQKMGRENLGLLRGHFDFFSREAASDIFSEEAIEDVANGQHDNS